MKISELGSYRIIEEGKIEELAADSLVLEHVKTGARVFLLPCQDDNKVFAIGFRTPPCDNTGAAHILEHSVLCGSGKYPVKDPFIELAKGSLNTFLNAMTYPDKTVYPVASCNHKDFENLMSVYLDAVFDPNIYREEKIFRQEGWHFELADEKSELTVNGVVYNEMKGVYSSADGVLDRSVCKALFEGHPYGYESGGEPDSIPDLTYEGFLDFHRKYYHPSNSFIYLYGDADMAYLLDKIDREYLSHYEKKEVDSVIPAAKPFEKPQHFAFEYSISDTESEENGVFLSTHSVVGGELDPLAYTGFQILDYLLLEVPGAPLREALIGAGIGDDISGGYSSGIAEPYFSVIARNARKDQEEEFLRIIHDTLTALVGGGIDREAVRAAINVMEFRAREADFGSYPKGLIYGLQSFDSWLYDSDPCMHLRYNAVYRELKERIDQGYFEQLIAGFLLDNPYTAVIRLDPVRGLTSEKEEKLKEKLAVYKDSLSVKEREEIVRETAALKAYQSEPSSQEDLLKIPMLKRSDIERNIPALMWVKENRKGFDVIYSDIFTSGIAYIKLLFDLRKVKNEDIPYVALLTEVLGYIDTETHSYARLATLTNLNSGGIGFSVDSYPDSKRCDETVMVFAANAKVLYDKTGFAFDAIDEILFSSKLDDVKRLTEIVAEVKARTKESILYSGNRTAAARAGAMITKDQRFIDATRGIEYYKMLESCDAKALPGIFRRICSSIFCRDLMTVNVICDKEGYEAVLSALHTSAKASSDLPDADRSAYYVPAGREAWTSSSMVNYVGRAGNFKKYGLSYDGALAVLRVILNYDYLWNNIRVLGGAYGCSARFGSSGASAFSSYRDPKLQKTDEVFEKIADFAGNYEADEREMTKAVIGAMSELDAPCTPLVKGLRSLSAYLSHVNDADRQKNRDQVLDVTPEKIRALKPIIEAVLKDGCMCALAGESAVQAEKEMFTACRPLYADDREQQDE